MFSNFKSGARLAGLAIILSSAVLTGCNYEQQIKAQQDQIDQLQAENRQKDDELVASRNVNVALRGEVEQKNSEIARHKARITELEAGKGPIPTPGETQTPGDWERGQNADRVSVGSDLLFSSGSAKLTSSGRSRLNQIASEIQRNYRGHKIRVYGYTDSDKIKKTRHLWQDNLDLSANRAMAVTRYLVGRGVNQANIESIGMGATNFVASNNTKAGKKKNRRVVIYVITGTK